MLNSQRCPNCGNKPMGWAKKLFGIKLGCINCGAKLRHDFLWSFGTLIISSLTAYFLMRYFFGVWVIIPVLFVGSLVIIATPLKRLGGSR